jgi:hypothetical protein
MRTDVPEEYSLLPPWQRCPISRDFHVYSLPVLSLWNLAFPHSP